MSPENQLTFSEQDRSQIRSHGLDEAQILAQLESFLHPPPPIELVRPCTVGDGIMRLNPSEAREIAQLQMREASKGRCMKFVPASGSASRMFSGLIALRKENVTSLQEVKTRARRGEPHALQVLEFLENLERFPFMESSQR